ncbi:uncharacterized protein LOC134696686 [Mytilus trossulus]|uniref:uncharacterized protein LOC134696686 n=1 Tax=Mytilus trossulus TaxID=6551 RepID=UPI0030061C8C
MMLKCVCVELFIIMISLSGVYGFYKLGQCPQFENCVSLAIKKGTLFNTLVQELVPGDNLGILDAGMELICRNRPAVVRCLVDMTYQDCYQAKRLMQAYDRTDFQQISDGFCYYTDEMSDLLRIVTKVNNRQWFFSCIEYMFIGITESKTGQTYLEYFRCSKYGIIPAIDELSVCFTEHLEGTCDEDIIIFVRERALDIQKYSCSRAEKHMKQQIMNIFESFVILKEKLVRVKR